jgi:uncharacterized protein
VPAIGLIVISFALIVLLMRFKIPLFASLFIACVFIILVARSSVMDAVGTLGSTIADPEVISLCIIIALILLFSEALRIGGRLNRVVTAFENLRPGNRLKLIAFPALIGLLPMPGGAVFSAPMVEAAGRGMPKQPGWFSAVNYWFRHVWEYWWPLYPGVLLATTLSGIPMGTYTLAMLPFSAIAITVGVSVILKNNYPDLDSKTNNQNGTANPQKEIVLPRRMGLRILLGELAPIIIVVVGGVGLELGREVIEKAGFDIPQPLARSAIILSLIAALIYTFKQDAIPYPKLIKDWLNKQNAEMVAMIILVVYYKNLLDAAGLIDKTVEELLVWKVPLWGVITILPFLLGLITGIQFAAVGVSFPVILGMAKVAGIPPIAVVSYAYVVGFMGTMISPVHFCLLLTKEYFHDGFGVVYRRIALPVIVMLLTAVFLAALYTFSFSQVTAK